MLLKQQALDGDALVCKRVVSLSFCFYCISSIPLRPTLIALALLFFFGNEPGFYSWIPRIAMAFSERTPA